MSSALTDAIREAYTVCPSNVVIYDTLEIRHPALAETLYLVRGREDITLRLETGVDALFVGTGFRMALPGTGDTGLQELTLVVDNIDRRVSDFVAVAVETEDPIEVFYRPYLSTDTTRPQMNPPLALVITDVTVNTLEVQCRASFADLLNRKFPTQVYNRTRFPSLGDL